MRILSWLLILTILGGAGFAAYWFLWRDQAGSGAVVRAYPRSDSELNAKIEIATSPWGYAELSGETWGDLLFAQGLQHDVRAGNQLLGLRELFKGNREGPIPNELRSLSDWFHYLHLEYTAQQSVALYPANARVLLQRYVDGLNAASGDADQWTIADVLLMQRGYAFLLGHNFSKEVAANHLQQALGIPAYQAIRNYPGEITALPSELFFADTLRPLFEGPYFTWIRMQDPQGNLATLCHSRPAWRRLLIPTTFNHGESFSANGFTLAGIPFLLSGQTPQLSFHFQPILANDEQFHLIPPVMIESEPELLQQDTQDPSNSGRDQPASVTPFGRDITPLVSGAGSSLLFYDWAGFRPSADLLMLERMLTATNLDQAQAALSLHQVPAAEITLGEDQQALLRYTLIPKSRPKEMPLTQEQPPFDGNAMIRNVPRPGARSWQFTLDQQVDLEKWRDPNQFGSDLDERLADALQAWASARLGGRISSTSREGVLQALRNADPKQRDYFLQLAWHQFAETFNEVFFQDRPRYMLSNSQIELKRFILNLISREPGQVTVSQRELLIAQALSASLRSYQQAQKQKPSLPLGFTDRDPVSVYTQLRSSDAVVTPYMLQSPLANPLSLQTHATLMLQWQEGNQKIWLFPFQTTEELGWPKKVYSASSAISKTVSVRPAKAQ